MIETTNYNAVWLTAIIDYIAAQAVDRIARSTDATPHYSAHCFNGISIRQDR